MTTPGPADSFTELPGTTRLTVVDYRKSPAVQVSERDVPYMALSWQDGGRTLKIFISGAPSGGES